MKKLVVANGILFILQIIAFAALIFSLTYYQNLDGFGLMVWSVIALVVFALPVIVIGTILATKRAKPFIVHVPLVLNIVLVCYMIFLVTMRNISS